MVNEKTWEEFQEFGMLWFVNMILHVFGWAICVEMESGNIIRAFPARVKFRGFDNSINSAGYLKVSEYLNKHAKELLNEAED